MAGAAKGKKFEEELGDLEQIVSRIDSGELSLEESIAAFERGVALVRSLNGKLDEIERKVEVLIKTAQGELKAVPFESGGGEPGIARPSESAAEASQENLDRDDLDKDDDTPF
ncbi:MAG TPA: exodeoxyribonuclease VII small subunit [Candidatus Binataceae bacterium]|jgi:exodeoxyribonuclease VII small subunit|nr:exodeoxyribonuclease VII small subunit [Candidatus Binataceae bacterium]